MTRDEIKPCAKCGRVPDPECRWSVLWGRTFSLRCPCGESSHSTESHEVTAAHWNQHHAEPKP